MSLSDQSDSMLFTNISHLQFKDRKTNDLNFIYQMSKSTNRCRMDRDAEFKMLTQNYRSKQQTCVKELSSYREPNRPCPHPELDQYYMQEFLLTPCFKPTYKNHLVCNEDKCCSKRHQLFKNVTKRKDITLI